MVKRNRYTQGVFHKLKIRQIGKDESYKIDELFLILLDEILKQWFSLIIKLEKDMKRKPVIRYYDLRIYSKELNGLLNEVSKVI